MEFLRRFAIVLLIIATVFSVWASIRYNAGLNTDIPTLTSDTELLNISVNDGEEALLKGLTAYDKTDGDITDRILVASVSHFLELGTVSVKYVVFDAHNNSATLTRRVCYTDYKAPRFTLSKNPVYARGETFDLLDYLTVSDDLDGDISHKVKVLYNDVTTSASGVYPVAVEVSNSCGGTAELTLQVTYLSAQPSVTVTLTENLVYLEQNARFDAKQWLASVTDSEDEALDTEDVTIQGEVDTAVPGTYQLVYSYDLEKLSGQAVLTVVVTEEVPS